MYHLQFAASLALQHLALIATYLSMAAPFQTRFHFYQSISKAESRRRRHLLLQLGQVPPLLLVRRRLLRGPQPVPRVFQIRRRRQSGNGLSHFLVTITKKGK